ncbi:PREDICTED: probable ATP-dependent helicase PF08_0048 [Trachymyrmex septentrionalis]|uniref:probable ATP-dependent helicase PF08_0048 n=1 Tax=Trachymyrmex septentrionalis TaxID=34720 RepID=UPI00084F1EA6|nr:PREDICTED: probable ATP-dependent helicase PF08_0048 [Trachymyrmex septentrionalis]
MRALYTLLILIAIEGVFERAFIEAKPYEVKRDGNPSSGRNLKNNLLNNIEENDYYNIKRNYDDNNHKTYPRCNNYANNNDDDDGDDDDITTNDNPTTDSDDIDDDDDIVDIDDIDDIGNYKNHDFLSGRDPKNNLQNNIEENDNNNNKLDHHMKDKEDDDEDNDDDDEDDDNFFLELITMIYDYLLDFIRSWLCKLPLINFICDDIYISKVRRDFITKF